MKGVPFAGHCACRRPELNVCPALTQDIPRKSVRTVGGHADDYRVSEDAEPQAMADGAATLKFGDVLPTRNDVSSLIGTQNSGPNEGR